MVEIHAPSIRIEHAGIFVSRVFYSTLATSIFYFISQYIPVVIPRRTRKIKILENVHHKTIMIDWYLSRLRVDLNVMYGEFEDPEQFRKKLRLINTGQPVGACINWFQYLKHLRERIVDATRAITIYNEFLSVEYLHEIIIIEENLLKPGIFEGIPYINTGNLEWAEVQLQEVLVHNKILQNLREKEFKKYEKVFKQFGQEYLQTNYAEYDKKQAEKASASVKI